MLLLFIHIWSNPIQDIFLVYGVYWFVLWFRRACLLFILRNDHPPKHVSSTCALSSHPLCHTQSWAHIHCATHRAELTSTEPHTELSSHPLNHTQSCVPYASHLHRGLSSLCTEWVRWWWASVHICYSMSAWSTSYLYNANIWLCCCLYSPDGRFGTFSLEVWWGSLQGPLKSIEYADLTPHGPFWLWFRCDPLTLSVKICRRLACAQISPSCSCLNDCVEVSRKRTGIEEEYKVNGNEENDSRLLWQSALKCSVMSSSRLGNWRKCFSCAWWKGVCGMDRVFCNRMIG